MTDVESQLRDYVTHLLEAAPAVSTIVDGTDVVPVPITANDSTSGAVPMRSRRRLAVLAAAACLVIVGSVVVRSAVRRDTGAPLDAITTTSPVPAPTTTPTVIGRPPPPTFVPAVPDPGYAAADPVTAVGAGRVLPAVMPDGLVLRDVRIGRDPVWRLYTPGNESFLFRTPDLADWTILTYADANGIDLAHISISADGSFEASTAAARGEVLDGPDGMRFLDQGTHPCGVGYCHRAGGTTTFVVSVDTRFTVPPDPSRPPEPNVIPTPRPSEDHQRDLVEAIIRELRIVGEDEWRRTLAAAPSHTGPNAYETYHHQMIPLAQLDDYRLRVARVRTGHTDDVDHDPIVGQHGEVVVIHDRNVAWTAFDYEDLAGQPQFTVYVADGGTSWSTSTRFQPTGRLVNDLRVDHWDGEVMWHAGANNCSQGGYPHDCSATASVGSDRWLVTVRTAPEQAERLNAVDAIGSVRAVSEADWATALAALPPAVDEGVGPSPFG